MKRRVNPWIAPFSILTFLGSDTPRHSWSSIGALTGDVIYG
jgi:hypothetical protein